MVRTPHLFLAHMPKTGGTWASEALRVVGRDRCGGGHDPIWKAWPEWTGSRRLGGTIRDPWSWYVSLYEHATNNGSSAREAMRTWGGGSLDFRDVLYGMTHPTADRVPKHPGGIWRAMDANVTSNDLLTTGACGLWTWAVLYFYGADSDCYRTGRVEWGVDFLVDTAQVATAMSGLTDEDLTCIEPVNTRTSRCGPDQIQGPPKRTDYYVDPDMWSWVENADTLAADFGWTPFGKGAHPVWSGLRDIKQHRAGVA
jgi:hypothetical protein